VLVRPKTLLLLPPPPPPPPTEHSFVGGLLSCQGRILAAVDTDMLELTRSEGTLRIGGEIPALIKRSNIL